MAEAMITLRPLQEAEIPEVVSWFQGDVGFMANGTVERVTASDFAEALVGSSPVRVAELEGEGLIGLFRWDAHNAAGSYTVGIVTAPDHVGTGYGALILEHGLGYLFNQVRAHRIELRTATYNHHVLGMLRAGYMTVEGILRDNIFVDGRYESTVIASMLENEYRELLRTGRMTPAPPYFPESDLRRGRASLRAALTSKRVSRSWEELLDGLDPESVGVRPADQPAFADAGGR